MSLRFKLLLAASLLLAVPVAGYRFVLAMEVFLRAHQVDAAAGSARTIAQALRSRPDLIDTPTRSSAPEHLLYVHPLARAPQVDGYVSDWGPLALEPRSGGVRAAHFEDALYLQVLLPATARPLRLRLVLEDAPGFARAWLLDAAAPGPLLALEVPPAQGMVAPGHADGRILCAVQFTAGGAVFEIRMPMALQAHDLRVEVLAAQAPIWQLPASGTYAVLIPPPGLSALVRTLAGEDGRRLRVTDARGRVLAQAGTLPAGAPAPGLARLLDAVLGADDESLLSLTASTLTLDGPEVRAALAGQAAARLRRDESEGVLVVSAAQPLTARGRIVGALVLEESTSRIQALARHATVELAVTAGAAFAFAGLVILAVAARAAARLRTLRDQAASAIDASGRVQAQFTPPGGGDEIGDLGRSFASALHRLQGYQDYLEQLAQRLSHELRTPIAVIRSSLDNLAMSGGKTGTAHDERLARALAGVDRLDALVRRMSEAARVEQAMSDSQRVVLDLRALVDGAAQGFAQAVTQPAVVAQLAPGPLRVRASPDLVLQALDKLIANARDFARPGTDVLVVLERAGDMARLAVENTGPALPAGGRDRLFDSMVSVRDREGGGEPHLGLGLYVVRLVAEFHGGRTFAEDRPHDRVRVGMLLPLER